MRTAAGVVVKLSSPVWGKARQIIVDLNIYNFSNSLTGLQQQLTVNLPPFPRKFQLLGNDTTTGQVPTRPAEQN